MGFMSALLKLIVVLLIISVVVAPAWSTSLPIKGASTYGLAPSTYGSTSGTFTDGSFGEETICPSNDANFPNGCNFAYVFTLSVTPPTGSQLLTIDFPTAISGVSLSLLYCDSTTTVPCGSLTGSPIAGSLVSDGGTGQELIFTDLTQLKGQNVSLIFVDSAETPFFDQNGDPLPVHPNVPSFSATWGTGSVATPEPTSLALLGVGLVAFSGKLRRKLA